MERYTPNTTMRRIYLDPLLASVQNYLIYRPGAESAENDRFPDKPIKDCAGNWAVTGVLGGLNLLAREIENDRIRQYFLYGAEDCADDPLKKDVNLIRLLPETASAGGKPFIILAAGGAYKWVSTIIESLPTAVHFLNRGYTVFLLTYRVSTERAALKALDDLAAAVRYVSVHAGELGVQPDSYALGGFSASGNLICNFGVPELGYGKYGLPAPRAMFPVYAYIDLKTRSMHNCIGDLLSPMFSEDFASYIDMYNLVDRIGAGFPPCYIVCGKDDMSVPPSNSETLAKLLTENGIPAVLDEGGHAPHAFGDGTGTDVEGWPERAMDFLEKLTARG
ncbi:MAG: alpha/beta hydrolase [Clostridia bacterium]|nr:alpha/beta hydrolase [Clostridia bacterium]